ncbi:hypothetical protein [Actinocatenispora comari]|uniref:hypothetical protein n=1 Tax=Actinocatenispora comari TaxID=2807577 RepID=UPI001A937F91|nr:hypothetical protein [Actinocatenispora comari]
MGQTVISVTAFAASDPARRPPFWRSSAWTRAIAVRPPKALPIRRNAQQPTSAPPVPRQPRTALNDRRLSVEITSSADLVERARTAGLIA